MTTWTRDGGFDSWPQVVSRVRELETENALLHARLEQVRMRQPYWRAAWNVVRHLVAAGARRWTP
jgi:hypothetical protein